MAKWARLTRESRKSYRSKFLVFLYFQVGIIAVSLLIYFAGYFSGRLEFQLLGLSVILLSQVTLIFSSSQVPIPITSRLVDIYPSLAKVSPWGLRFFIATLLFCPLTALGLLLFLYFAEKRPRTAYVPFYFSRPIASGLLTLGVMLLPFGAQIPTSPSLAPRPALKALSYFISNQSTHYLVTLGEEVKVFMNLKESLNFDATQRQAVAAFDQLSRKQNFTTTGLVLATSIIVMEDMKRIQYRDPASLVEKDSVGATNLVEDLVKVVEYWDRSSPPVLRVNPISLLTPYVSLETALVGSIEILLEARFRQVFMSKLVGMIQTLSQNPSSEIREKASSFRAALESTRNYKAFLNTKDSWISNLL